jgi:hypothetical protein
LLFELPAVRSGRLIAAGGHDVIRRHCLRRIADAGNRARGFNELTKQTERAPVFTFKVHRHFQVHYYVNAINQNLSPCFAKVFPV